MNESTKDVITGICFALICCLAAVLGGVMACQFAQSGLPIPILP